MESLLFSFFFQFRVTAFKKYLPVQVKGRFSFIQKACSRNLVSLTMELFVFCRTCVRQASFIRADPIHGIRRPEEEESVSGASQVRRSLYNVSGNCGIKSRQVSVRLTVCPRFVCFSPSLDCQLLGAGIESSLHSQHLGQCKQKLATVITSIVGIKYLKIFHVLEED